jgi:hypothetical protein
VVEGGVGGGAAVLFEKEAEGLRAPCADPDVADGPPATGQCVEHQAGVYLPLPYAHTAPTHMFTQRGRGGSVNFERRERESEWKEGATAR